MDQSSIAKTLSLNIKACRKKNGITQDDLSKLLNVTRGRVGAWEEGRSTPNYEHALLMANLFDVGFRQFITTVI